MTSQLTAEYIFATKSMIGELMSRVANPHSFDPDPAF